MTAAGPELISGAGTPTTPRPRLAWLDALRALAVVAVVVQHGGELASRGFARVTHDDAQLGQAGVLLFFLVSGFVIPLALDRRPSLRRFAVTRLARLYPAYLLSIFLVWAAWHAKLVEVPLPFRHHLPPWLANLTMLQTLLGQPQLQGQYWSLVFELIFYTLSGALLALRLHRRSVALAVLALLGALVLHALARITGHAVPLGLGDVATMFVGSVLFRVHSGTVSLRTGWRIFALGVVCTQAILVLRLAGAADASTGVSLTLLPMAVAWGLAYAVFGIVFARRAQVPTPRWLVRIGEISYSVYLLHALVIAVVGKVVDPLLSVLCWLVLSLLLAWLSWRLVETPASRAGRRLAGLAESRGSH